MQEPRPLAPMRPVRAVDVPPERRLTLRTVLVDGVPFVIAAVVASATHDRFGLWPSLALAVGAVVLCSVGAAAALQVLRRRARP